MSLIWPQKYGAEHDRATPRDSCVLEIDYFVDPSIDLDIVETTRTTHYEQD